MAPVTLATRADGAGGPPFKVLAEDTRAKDVIARIGGDEFGALLRYSDEQAAAEWRRRLSERLAKLNAAAGRRPLTISVGIAQALPDATIGDALADRRMDAEKTAQRLTREPLGPLDGRLVPARADGVEPMLQR